jgi:hypothetical protein
MKHKLKLYNLIDGKMVETDETDPFIDFFNSMPDIEKPERKYKTYIIEDTTNHCFKIGRSIDCTKRLKVLSTNNPSLKLHFIIDKDVEKELHDEYEIKRMHGEWFNLTERDLLKIKIQYYGRIN